MEVPDAVVAKLLYIVVVEDDIVAEIEFQRSSFRYTRSVLQSTLQLMGCKPRHAFKISRRVFEMIRQENLVDKLVSAHEGVSQQDAKVHRHAETGYRYNASLNKADIDNSGLIDVESKSKPFELYKKRTTVFVRRKNFLDVVCEALSEYKYMGPNQRDDLILACRLPGKLSLDSTLDVEIEALKPSGKYCSSTQLGEYEGMQRLRERKESVTVLLCGTSGCGKSTLSALLGSRLGITTVVSTDSIRHMMRSFVDEKQNPLLWASTYHAGEYLDPVAVSEAKDKKKAKKSAAPAKDSVSNHSTTGKSEGNNTVSDLISPKQMAVEGFKAQSEMVIESLDRLITAWEERKESVVVEGVHLSLNFVMGLMKKHPSIIPFMIYISNEEKHLERFAVRAKYMTLDPARNKYVKYIRNIRTIQEYLCNRADKHLVPKINNTNVDKSVATIHATVFSCLRRREAGEHLYDPMTNTVTIVDEECRNQCTANSLSSKGMFQLIQRQGSSRHLMALLNYDGSVAKAWPLDMVDDNGKPISGSATRNGIGTPMYGPLQIGKSEPVNLQFGHFGISAWPSDTGGTSHASSVDESRGELTDTGSKYYSSCCSTPRTSDGHAKELKEEQSVHGSDEEVDETPEADSDDDLNEPQGELEGSVDEGSTKSDEEYDDLAMQDITENGYMPDEEFKQLNNKKTETNASVSINIISGGDETNKRSDMGEKYQQNLDLFLRTKSEPLSENQMRAFAAASPLRNKKAGPFARKRSLSSIPAFGKQQGLQLTVSIATDALPR